MPDDAGRRRLAEYFAVAKLAKDPLRIAPTAAEGLDEGFVQAANALAEAGNEGLEELGQMVENADPELFALPRGPLEDDPIVDVCVIFPNQKEKIPAGYTCLVRTPFGYRGDCNSGVVGGEGVFICFKRASSRTKGRMTYPESSVVVDVQVVFVEKEPVPPGYELIQFSRTGIMPANLNYGYLGQAIHLAVKRVSLEHVSPEERYHSVQPIIDMCIINASKHETIPHGFECLAKSTSDGNWTGSKMYICIRRAKSFGMLDIAFASALVERVPREDRADIEFPAEIAMLTSPNGMKLCRRETTNVPLPQYFAYVLSGSDLHASCFTFYETLDEELARCLENSYDEYLRIMSTLRSPNPMIQRQLIASSLLGRCTIDGPPSNVRNAGSTRFLRSDSGETVLSSEDDSTGRLQVPLDKTLSEGRHARQMSRQSSAKSFQSTSSSVKSRGLSEYKIYCPVTLCILSRYPFYREFKRFLMLLYQVSISKTLLPLEAYVGQLIFELPVPRPGLSGYELRFGSGDHTISFSLPSESGLPLSSVNYETVFRCLSPKGVAQLFTLLLLEKRIILHSRYLSVLNQVAESIRALMFPLNWQHVFVPVCPANLVDYLHAPMPFLIGIHSDAVDVNAWPSDAWEVCLDEGTIYYLDALENVSTIALSNLLQTPPGGAEIDPLRVVRSNKQPPSLPTAILNAFIKRLAFAVHKYAPMIEDDMGKGARKSYGLQSPDMAYGMTPLEASGEQTLHALQFAVRDAAIQVMIELIGVYRDYLLPPKLALQGLRHTDVSPTNLSNIFNLTGFLSAIPKLSRPFVTELAKSLHFTKFIDERTFSTLLSYKFLFFDAVTTEYNSPHSPTGGIQSASPESMTDMSSSLGDLKGTTGLRAASSLTMTKSTSPKDRSISSQETLSEKPLKRPSSFVFKGIARPSGMFSSPSRSTNIKTTNGSGSSTESLLVQRVISRMDSFVAGFDSEEMEAFQAGGGEEHFVELRESRKKKQKQLAFLKFSKEPASPWKDSYTYEHFPEFNETLLMSYKSTNIPELSSQIPSPPHSFSQSTRGRSASTPPIPVSRSLSVSTSSEVSPFSNGPGTFSPKGPAKNIWEEEGERKINPQKGSDLLFVTTVDTQLVHRSVSGDDKGSLNSIHRPNSFDHLKRQELVRRYHTVHESAEKTNRLPLLQVDEKFSDDGSIEDSSPGVGGSKNLQTKELSRVNSSVSRFGLAGKRMAEELNHTRLELQFAFSEINTGMPRAKSCFTQALGAWLGFLPALLSSGQEKKLLVLSQALANVARLTQEHGYVLDEAGCRALLASCSMGGHPFAPDANHVFHMLVGKGHKPNAVTYGFFTHALTNRRTDNVSTKSRRNRSKHTWRRLQTFLSACSRFRVAGKGKLEAVVETTIINGSSRLICISCSTKCPNCKSRLLDEHMMKGWMVDDTQLALECPFCDFLIVPRLHFTEFKVNTSSVTDRVVGEEEEGDPVKTNHKFKFDAITHGQCEYMSPLVLRRATEHLIEESRSENSFGLSEDFVKTKNIAVFYNLLWFSERMGLISLFLKAKKSEYSKTVVACSWAPMASDSDYLDYVMTTGGRKKDQGRGGESSPHKKRLRKKYTTAGTDSLDPSMYMVDRLKTFETLESSTLWGNKSVATMLNDAELAHAKIPEKFFVTSESSPTSVIRKLVYYLEELKLSFAVRLFLSARMASRTEEESNDHREYDSGFVLQGWEVFSNSIYIEFYALTKMSKRVRAEHSDPVELDLERSLAKVLREMDKVDPTLASYVNPQDYPPSMVALSFRTFFKPLYP